jgi:outer membrane receptor protein involved in Fe transport
MKTSNCQPALNSLARIIVFFILAVFCLNANGYAQASPEKTGSSPVIPKNGKVTGKVIDSETNSPMEYANIIIYNKTDSKMVTGSISNATGTFVIADLPFGTYYVEASFIGFEKTVINDIKIAPNSATVNIGNINLSVSKQQIGAVEVIAERNRVEYKIDKKVINVTNDINANGGTAVTVLENTPSVEVDIDGNVSLRGSSSFTVLIDGRPSVLTGSDALKQIPSSAIQNIEIITNPSVKYDPDGMAGIINIVMKKNIISGVNGIVNLNLGTGDKYGADFLMNYKTKKYNLFLGGNWNDNTDNGTMFSTRESYAKDTTTFLTNDGSRNQSRYGQQLKGGFDYYPTDNTSFTVSSEIGKYGFSSFGGVNIHKYELPGTMNIYSTQNSNDSRDGNFISAAASFLTKLNDKGTHKLEGSFDYRNRDGYSDEKQDEFLSDAAFNKTSQFLSRVISHENSNEDDIRIKLDYTLPFNDDSRFEAGVQSRIESEKESLDFQDFNTTTQQFQNNPDFTSSMKFREEIHSVYSTYTGNLKAIQFVFGLRGEYNKRTTSHYKEGIPINYDLDRFDFFPSAHLSYNLASESQLMASYSRRINRPGGRELDPFPSYMNQYTIRTGNPGLKPEYTDSYEFSYMKKFGNSFVSLETFYRTTNNLITEVNKQVDQILYLNIENLNRDYSMGGEIMGNINVNKWLLVNTSFTLYNYKLKGEILGVSVDKESTNYSGRLNTTVKFTSDSRLQLTGFYRGPSVSAQGEQKGMAFANLSYRQELMKKKLTATLSVRDVFGTMRMQRTSAGENFKSAMKMTREPRVLMLTLSYKINNFKMGRESNQEESEPSFDSGE